MMKVDDGFRFLIYSPTIWVPALNVFNALPNLLDNCILDCIVVFYVTQSGTEKFSEMKHKRSGLGTVWSNYPDGSVYFNVASQWTRFEQ